MKGSLANFGLVTLALMMLAPALAEPFQNGTIGQIALESQEAKKPWARVSAEDSNPRAEAAMPPGSTVERDIAYGPDVAQRMDVYLPRHSTAAPVLFMVHGGAWMIGDKASRGVVTNKVGRWLPKGYIVVSANYRLLPKADPLEQANDIAKALASAQSRARSWGGDPARFVLMGHSAGAHLVALLAADPGIASRQGAKPWLGTISLDSAALDVVQTMEAKHMRLYDKAFREDPGYWRDASPFHRLARASGPMLLVCSTRRSDSCPQARSFARKATSFGGRATVLPIALSHREVNQNLGLAGDYTEAVESFLRSVGLP